MKKLILFTLLFVVTTISFAQSTLKMTSSTLLIFVDEDKEVFDLKPEIDIYLTDENLIIFSGKTQTFTFVGESLEGDMDNIPYISCYATDQNDKVCYITLFTPENDDWILNISFIDYELYYSVKVQP